MKSLLFHYVRHSCLVLLTTSFLAEALTLRHEQPLPSPCDQLEGNSLRERCARFLADRETLGCQTFTNAIAVDSFARLKAGMEQEDYPGGVILLVTTDIEIENQNLPRLPMAVNGIVAIVGDPGRRPKIGIIDSDARSVIAASGSGKPGALFCWGIEWIKDSPQNLFLVREHFGTVRIMHSIFRAIDDPLPAKAHKKHQYLTILMGDSPGMVKNNLLIAHNQFHGVPAAYLEDGKSADIFVSCNVLREWDEVISTCYEPGEVMIRGNTWHGHSHYPENITYHAIKTNKIAQAHIIGNRAADSNGILSVYMGFNHPMVSNNGTYYLGKLNLQLVNNTALPEMEARNRQFYFDIETLGESSYSLPGVVNMTCNRYFNFDTSGSFAHPEQYNLAITEGNNYCMGLAEEDYGDNIQCGQTTAIPPTPVINEAPMPIDDNCHDSGRYFIITYALGASTATLAALSWGLFWSLAYHHTSGKTQTLVNALALFIPGCFHRALEQSLEKP